MLLDIRTLMFITLLCAGGSAVGFLVFVPRHSGIMRSQGIALWGIANATHALAGVLLMLRGILPDAISIVAAHVMVVLTGIFHYQALTVFFGGTVSRRLPLIGALIVVLVSGYWTFVIPDMRARLVIASLYIVATSSLCAWVLLARRSEIEPLLCRLMGASYVVTAVIWAVRIYHTQFLRDPNQSLFENTPLESAAYGSILLLLIFATFGFMLLITSRMHAELRRLAAIDPLTAVWNRGTSEVMLERTVAHARRAQEACALLILDIDRFKQVNDTFGHPAGDQVLRLVVSTIVQLVRVADTVGRFGGEEFVIILPGTSLAGATQLAERLRATIAQTPVAIDGSMLDVTISIGVAALHDGEGMPELLRRADRALLLAKAEGRNRVVEATALHQA